MGVLGRLSSGLAPTLARAYTLLLAPTPTPAGRGEGPQPQPGPGLQPSASQAGPGPLSHPGIVRKESPAGPAARARPAPSRLQGISAGERSSRALSWATRRATWSSPRRGGEVPEPGSQHHLRRYVCAPFLNSEGGSQRWRGGTAAWCRGRPLQPPLTRTVALLVDSVLQGFKPQVFPTPTGSPSSPWSAPSTTRHTPLKVSPAQAAWSQRGRADAGRAGPHAVRAGARRAAVDLPKVIRLSVQGAPRPRPSRSSTRPTRGGVPERDGASRARCPCAPSRSGAGRWVAQGGGGPQPFTRQAWGRRELSHQCSHGEQ